MDTKYSIYTNIVQAGVEIKSIFLNTTVLMLELFGETNLKYAAMCVARI